MLPSSSLCNVIVFPAPFMSRTFETFWQGLYRPPICHRFLSERNFGHQTNAKKRQEKEREKLTQLIILVVSWSADIIGCWAHKHVLPQGWNLILANVGESTRPRPLTKNNPWTLYHP